MKADNVTNHKLWFQAICDCSGHLCTNKSFLTMDNISVMCCNLCYVAF